MFLKLCFLIFVCNGVLGAVTSDCIKLQESLTSCTNRGYKLDPQLQQTASQQTIKACTTLMKEMLLSNCNINTRKRQRRNVQKRDAGFCSGNLCYKMDTGAVLPIGSSLISANGKYELKMQPDKNLVLYCYAGNPIWHASTWGHNIDTGLRFTKDGKLEIIEVGTGNMLWTNGVSGGEMLFLQNDGNLVVYDIQERDIWQTGTDLQYCEKGYCSGDRCVKPSSAGSYASLKLGEQLISKNGKYDLRMQRDGNLVAYCNGNNPIWHSATYGKSVTGGLRFQFDSNLVIYDPAPIWASGTHNSGATTLVMQDDGNIVMYKRDGTPVWHTDTYNMC